MFDLFWPAVAYAQTPTGPAGGAQQRFFAQLVLILMLVVIMYFLIMRPQMKRQKQVQQMLKGLKNGDRVITTGGLYGQVHSIRDDVVVLKISDEVKVEVAKSAVSGVLTK